MKNDAAWLRAMGKTLLRMAEQPERSANNDVYTALRGIAFDCAAMAIVLDEGPELGAADFVAEDNTQPFPSGGVTVALSLPKGT